MSNDTEAEVELIGPSNTLRAKIGRNVNLDEVFTEDKIARAQNIITEAQDNFLIDRTEILKSLADILKKKSPTEADFKKISRTSQDIMGQAETLGYHALSATLHSLNSCVKNKKTHATILEKHAQVIEVVLLNNQKDFTPQTREILEQALPELVAHFYPSGQ